MDHFEPPQPAGRDPLELITFAAAEHGSAQRREHGDRSVLEVGIARENERENPALAGVQGEQLGPAVHGDRVGRDLLRRDDLRARQFVLEPLP